MFRKIISGLGILGISFFTFASTVETVPKQEIANVRVEGSYGFIGFSNAVPSGSTCKGNRVWINLNEEVGRVKYSTALTAFASGKQVILRSFSNASVVFGACELYDIYVLK
jgi:hypothetical protein